MGGLNCPGGEILGSGLGVGSDSDVERGGGVVAVVVLGFWFGGEVVLELGRESISTCWPGFLVVAVVMLAKALLKIAARSPVSAL